jgi:hypothetical protein
MGANKSYIDFLGIERNDGNQAVCVSFDTLCLISLKKQIFSKRKNRKPIYLVTNLKYEYVPRTCP